jgi:hypothetical protein
MAPDGSTTTDEDMMKKAMSRKAEKNLDNAGTTSFTGYSDSRIIANLNSVGVSLGSNALDVSVSTNVLRHLEYDRIKVIPKALTVSEPFLLDEEEPDATFDGQLLSSLVGVISEDDSDKSRLGSLYELQASRRKSKSSAEKKIRRTSKVTKSTMVSK